MAKQEELSDELIQEAIKKDAKLWVDNAPQALNESLGLENAKITMRGSAIKHALNRHGIDSEMAKNGQPPIDLSDIKNHAYFIKNADMQTTALNKDNQKVLISGKQVNGYYVVVETISAKDNELKFKTMYKEKGDLKENEIFTKALQDHLENGGESLRVNPSNPLDKASGFSPDIIPQETKLFNQAEIKIETLDDFRHYAKLSGFENLPQEQLEKAHKYILENLHKVEC